MTTETDKAHALAEKYSSGEDDYGRLSFNDGRLMEMLADHRQQVIAELAQRSVKMPESVAWIANYGGNVCKEIDVREAIASMQAQIEQLERVRDTMHRQIELYKEKLEQSEARAAELEKALRVGKIESTLDQAANGSHLDDIPNHDDDSIRMIAFTLQHGWERTKLLAHADRLEMGLAAMKGASK